MFQHTLVYTQNTLFTLWIPQFRIVFVHSLYNLLHNQVCFYPYKNICSFWDSCPDNKPKSSLYNVSRLDEVHLDCGELMRRRLASVWPPDAFPGWREAQLFTHSLPLTLHHASSLHMALPRWMRMLPPGPVTMATAVGAGPTFTNPVRSDLLFV